MVDDGRPCTFGEKSTISRCGMYDRRRELCTTKGGIGCSHYGVMVEMDQFSDGARTAEIYVLPLNVGLPSPRASR